jgi:hypothetical protein
LKRQTKRQKLADLSDFLTCSQQGKPPKRLNQRAADGSIPTRPKVKTQVPEREVLPACLEWLKRKGCLVNRLNNGCAMTASGWLHFGINGAGDIIGCLPDGTHLEVECKAGSGGRLKQDQQDRMANVRAHHGVYVVVHSVDELEEQLGERIASGSISERQCWE